MNPISSNFIEVFVYIVLKFPTISSRFDVGYRKLDKSSSLFFDHVDPEMVEWFDEMVEVRKNQQRVELEQRKGD